MYVCICKAVKERQIREAVHGGAIGLRDLMRDLRVGTGCGKCVPTARAVLEETLALRRAAEAAGVDSGASLPRETRHAR
jgi:bacterioferritin-associated ferredoxin